MKLIVGLGNPGLEYTNTRHNIGFMVIDNYLSSLAWKDNNSLNINYKTINNVINNFKNMVTWQNKFKANYTSIIINNEKVYFVKPTTYMNLSGEAIIQFVKFFKIDFKDILVIHDDLDLPLGNYRLKTNSSAGGHNGLKSIINCLGTNSFARLKIGISNNKEIDTKNYVLGKFTQEEQERLKELYPIFNNIINDFLNNDINKLMNKYNRKP